MNTRKHITYLATIVYLIAMVWSCSSAHEQSRVEQITSSDDPIEYEISSKKLSEEQGFDLILTQISGLDEQFLIPKRAMEITSHPCANCHDRSIEILKKENKGGKAAHWHVAMEHADNATMGCATCHDMDKPNMLTTLNGKPTSYDHSYQLCSQCHSTQYKDWQGGAHGKSLAGWVPPRISQTCVGCHDPHKPGFPSRWPSRLNTVELGLKTKH